MPQAITPLADETPSDLAARTLGDTSLFREVLKLNPALDPFLPVLQSAAAGTLTSQEILVPVAAELANRAEPALLSVRTGIESALRVTEGAIARVEKYAAIAGELGLTDLSTQINGVLGPAKNLLGEGQAAVTEYAGSGGAIKLVDWLLG